MHLLMAGADLIYIRDLLGHSSVQTTEIYARTDTEFKRNALQKASNNILDTQIPQWAADKDLLDWLNTFK
jgi:integrase